MYHRLRWLAVVAGVLIIAAVEVVADTALDGSVRFPLDTLLVVAVVAMVAFVAASLDFRQIDRLTGDVMTRNAELESRNATLRAVYDVSLAVSGRKDPGPTIGTILQRARELLSMDAALLLIEDAAGESTIVAHSALPDAVLDVAPAADRGTAPGSEPAAHSLLAPGVEVRISVPVVLGDDRSGALELASRRGRVFSESEIGTVSALATQVGLAVEAARLQDEMRALAVQGERERIAREMHDGLAQVLAYVNAKSQAVDEMLADGRVPEARLQLGQLAEAARSLYVDVREAILSLSSPLATDRSVAAAIEEYATQYAESSKLAVRFEATSAARAASLSAAVQGEMFSIAREALTNVRKHARAQRVRIRLSVEGGEVVLSIEDDGVGFDAAGLTRAPERWPHFGLAGMRERAESVGGRIAWISTPGRGTTVELRVPNGGTPSGGGSFEAAALGGTNMPNLPHQAGRSTDPHLAEAN
jgi:two-component system, NarL family, nitrate/nitrite sensor histidine kinase NarX